MIQLATDPKASRSPWRPAPGNAKVDAAAKTRRSGHAWPFISSQYDDLDDRPAPQDDKSASGAAGSGS